MKLLQKTSHYENIIAFLKDPIGDEDSLTEFEQHIITRIMEAFTLLRNYKSTPDAAAILMKRFPNISRSTAYRDCAMAISAFGDMSKSTKEGIRFFATEIAKDAINIARIKNNEDAMIRGAKAIADINGVNLIDPDVIDFSKLQPHTYTFSLPPEAMKVIMGMVKGGRVDFTDMVSKMQNVAEDAEIIEDTDGES